MQLIEAYKTCNLFNAIQTANAYNKCLMKVSKENAFSQLSLRFTHFIKKKKNRETKYKNKNKNENENNDFAIKSGKFYLLMFCVVVINV